MQFRGKLTEADLEDVRRIVRSKWYWPKLLASNWYGVLLLSAVIWATVAGLLGKTHANWRAVGILWVVILGIFGWVFYTTKKGMAKEFSQLNTTLPDWVSLVVTRQGHPLSAMTVCRNLAIWNVAKPHFTNFPEVADKKANSLVANKRRIRYTHDWG
jgi:hypothetical protein